MSADPPPVVNQQRFVSLSAVALGLVVASFVLLGVTRLVVGVRTAQVLASPVGFAGFALLAYLFVRATLAKVGLLAIEEG